MYLWFNEIASTENIITGINIVNNHNAVKTICILCAPGQSLNLETLDETLIKIKKPLLGGFFPSVIFDKKRYNEGVIVIGLESEGIINIVENVSTTRSDFEDLIDQLFPDQINHKTIMVLLDGFSKRIDKLIQSLFNVFGLEINYIGGGAGSLDMVQKPCIITNKGVLQDAAAVALLDMKSSVGVSHGWVSIQGPFKVTESDGNTLMSIDWEPAYDTYKNVILNHSGTELTPDNFFDVAKEYPFGIAKLGSERIVRDPVMVGENSSIVCVGEIPEGVFIDILHADNDALINAAKTAYKMSSDGIKIDKNNWTCLFIDCISRVLFLGDEFNKELAAVHNESFQLIGACTIGEIANCGFEFLEFYNKTAVVSLLEEPCTTLS